MSLRAAPCAGGSTRDRCFTLLLSLRPCAAAGVLFGLPREALGCLAAARGRRSSARARQCWESLGAGLSGGGVSAPKEASRGPRREVPTPPEARLRVGRWVFEFQVGVALLDPSALWGDIEKLPKRCGIGGGCRAGPRRADLVGLAAAGSKSAARGDAPATQTPETARAQRAAGSGAFERDARPARAAAHSPAVEGLILTSGRSDLACSAPRAAPERHRQR